MSRRRDPLSPAAQKYDYHLALRRIVNAITRSKINASFANSFPYRFRVSGVAKHQSRESSNIRPEMLYSGSGFPLVSGANGNAASPTRNTRHMVTPAYRIGSAYPANTRPVSSPKVNGPAAATSRPTL
jgi:hypothetical protein